MMRKVYDFKIGSSSHPEILRFRGDPRRVRNMIAEKLQIDPKQIQMELKPDLPSNGNARIFKLRGQQKRRK
jgi:hypothetical protein